jgi:hypothetical protein
LSMASSHKAVPRVGHIPLHTTMALGICFDRRRLADNAILMFNPATLEHIPSGKAGSP